MLKEEHHIKNEKYRGRIIMVFSCSEVGCQNTLRVPPHKKTQYIGKCQSCLKKKKPYGVAFNRLKINCRKKRLTNSLSYLDFLKFTKVKNCHYCESKVEWIKFKLGKNSSVPYNLDRKDPSKGYSIDNCVVCCTLCNKVKNNIFSYEEFKLIGKTIKQILSNRNIGGKRPEWVIEGPPIFTQEREYLRSLIPTYEEVHFGETEEK